MTLSLCAPENEEMTIWVTVLPWYLGIYELSITSNGLFLMLCLCCVIGELL